MTSPSPYWPARAWLLGPKPETYIGTGFWVFDVAKVGHQQSGHGCLEREREVNLFVVKQGSDDPKLLAVLLDGNGL